MRMRIAAFVAALSGLGCARVAEPGVEACEGMLVATPVQLATSSSSSSSPPELLVDGDTLVLVEAGLEGRLRRIDRCSGAELDAIDVAQLSRAIVHEGEVVLTRGGVDAAYELARWDAAAGLVRLGDVPFARVDSHTTGLYLVEGVEIHRFDEATGTSVSVHTIDAPSDVVDPVSHVGMHAAGIYFRLDYDSGVGSTLQRWPIGATTSSSVEGTESAVHLAASGDRIVTSVDQSPGFVGSGIRDIVVLPAAGGEPTRLFVGSSDDAWIRGIAANETWACWSGGPSVRCVDVHESAGVNEGAALHERASPGETRAIGLADDAVYWWAEVDAGHVLMAAAL
jgi:hypothetical protein